jgi:hypothetical protein
MVVTAVVGVVAGVAVAVAARAGVGVRGWVLLVRARARALVLVPKLGWWVQGQVQKAPNWRKRSAGRKGRSATGISTSADAFQ